MKVRDIFGATGLLVMAAMGWASHADAKQVTLDVSLSHPTLLAGDKQTTYIKVGLTGFEPTITNKRPPVNVALVLDKSGSMQGDKLAKAKQAAIQALHRLSASDIISIVAYDTTVQVVVPSTKLTDKASVAAAINNIQAGGNTALFAGVSKGAAEVRKFFDRKSVNRIILLSDGLANSGPSTPGELGRLGAELMKQGVAVSTLGLGLGYNEDLMFELARNSDGNHMFIEDATELAGVFDAEFHDVMSIVAQEVAITVRCAPEIRPIRLLGVKGDINGQNVVVNLNQLYRKEQKYVLLEVEVPASKPNQVNAIADVQVSYANMETHTVDRLASSIGVRFDSDPTVVAAHKNEAVLTECVLQIANLRNEEALVLRDRGEKAKAEEMLNNNAQYLWTNGIELNSPKLQKRADDNFDQSKKLDEGTWGRTRKGMRSQQYMDAQVQRADPVEPKTDEPKKDKP
jgi:Ca-activated chloride channel family protein